MVSYIVALTLGLGFGFSLNKVGLTQYKNVANQFRFTDMTILKFMMTAIAFAMTGLYIFRGLGWVTFPTVPATYIVGNLLGGLLFGVGMSLSGY